MNKHVRRISPEGIDSVNALRFACKYKGCVMIPSTVGMEPVIWLSDAKNFQPCRIPKIRRKCASQIIVV